MWISDLFEMGWQLAGAVLFAYVLTHASLGKADRTEGTWLTRPLTVQKMVRKTEEPRPHRHVKKRAASVPSQDVQAFRLSLSQSLRAGLAELAPQRCPASLTPHKNKLNHQ